MATSVRRAAAKETPSATEDRSAQAANASQAAVQTQSVAKAKSAQVVNAKQAAAPTSTASQDRSAAQVNASRAVPPAASVAPETSALVANVNLAVTETSTAPKVNIATTSKASVNQAVAPMQIVAMASAVRATPVSNDAAQAANAPQGRSAPQPVSVNNHPKHASPAKQTVTAPPAKPAKVATVANKRWPKTSPLTSDGLAGGSGKRPT